MIEVDFENWKNGWVPGEINNFSALLFMLIAKADGINIELIRQKWPTHVALYEGFMSETDQ